MNGEVQPFTFVVWSDTHFGYEPKFEGDIRDRMVAQINGLAGWRYPDWLDHAGEVVEPAFVLHCGDVLDRGFEHEESYFRHTVERLHYPHHYVLGNHDSPKYDFGRRFLERNDRGSYSFEYNGIHLLCPYQAFPNNEGCFEPHTMDWLQRTLEAQPVCQPVMVFLHAALDRVSGGSEVAELLSQYRTLVVFAGHHHKTRVFRYHDIDCIDVGHCRDHPIDQIGSRHFHVVRIEKDRLDVVPWRWDLGDWERGVGWAEPQVRMRHCTLTKTIGHE